MGFLGVLCSRQTINTKTSSQTWVLALKVLGLNLAAMNLIYLSVMPVSLSMLTPSNFSGIFFFLLHTSSLVQLLQKPCRKMSLSSQAPVDQQMVCSRSDEGKQPRGCWTWRSYLNSNKVIMQLYLSNFFSVSMVISQRIINTVKCRVDILIDIKKHMFSRTRRRTLLVPQWRDLHD